MHVGHNSPGTEIWECHISRSLAYGPGKLVDVGQAWISYASCGTMRSQDPSLCNCFHMHAYSRKHKLSDLGAMEKPRSHDTALCYCFHMHAYSRSHKLSDLSAREAPPLRGKGFRAWRHASYSLVMCRRYASTCDHASSGTKIWERCISRSLRGGPGKLAHLGWERMRYASCSAMR